MRVLFAEFFSLNANFILSSEKSLLRELSKIRPLLVEPILRSMEVVRCRRWKNCWHLTLDDRFVNNEIVCTSPFHLWTPEDLARNVHYQKRSWIRKSYSLGRGRHSEPISRFMRSMRRPKHSLRGLDSLFIEIPVSWDVCLNVSRVFLI